MLHYTKTCKFSIQQKIKNVKLMVNFPKRVTKKIVLLNDLQMYRKKVQTFYQYTTGIVLLSVAVSVSIYRDTYRITLHLSQYISCMMTAVSSQH